MQQPVEEARMRTVPTAKEEHPSSYNTQNKPKADYQPKFQVDVNEYKAQAKAWLNAQEGLSRQEKRQMMRNMQKRSEQMVKANPNFFQIKH